MFLIHHVVNILFVIYVRGDYRILGMSIMSQEDETLLVETWEELDECIPIMKSIMHAVYIIFHCVRSRCRLTIISGFLLQLAPKFSSCSPLRIQEYNLVNSLQITINHTQSTMI